MLFGVGIAIYYVLDLDWFVVKEKPVSPYIETPIINPYKEEKLPYDVTKRTYDILIKTDELKVVVRKDGSVGITLLANEINKEVEVYKEILEKEITTDIKNIIKAYAVQASKTEEPNTFIVFLDKDGNVYKLDNKNIVQSGKYVIEKIEGIAKIVDIKQITNTDLVENENGVNVIAIDYEGNELLLTSYLIEK